MHVFCVPNVFSVATDGKEIRYGSVGMPIEKWGPWRDEDEPSDAVPGLAKVGKAIDGLLQPEVILDFLRFFSTFGTDRQL